jgi:hypothetical protein
MTKLTRHRIAALEISFQAIADEEEFGGRTRTRTLDPLIKSKLIAAENANG